MLYSKILNLKQENYKFITVNPILEAFLPNICQEIDAAQDESFIREKKENILKFLKNYDVGHDDKLKFALDEYNEAATYLLLKNKGIFVERVAESETEKTPDFKVNLDGETFFIEMKTVGFAEGSINYLKAIDEALDANISLEQQLKSGRTTAIAVTAYDPLQTNKPNYLRSPHKYFIETIVQKIQQNLKEEQFRKGKTILLVDLSLISIAGWRIDSIPIYQESQHKSMVSGRLWHSAFGKFGERIFSSIEFEGYKNIEGELGVEGILNDRDWIKALCFQTYNLHRERKIVGFYRAKDEESILHLLYPICDFVNDDLNTNGWEILKRFR